VDNFTPATQGISNFVTAPDYIPTVLIRNATEEQLALCMEACRQNANIFNVYVQTTNSDEEWVWKIERIADEIIDAQKQNPSEYFNK
jgi:hypothetical protein